MERRELLMLGGLALTGTAAAGAARAAQVQPSPAWTSFLHIWTDVNGVGHAEVVPLSAKVKSVPIVRIAMRPEPSGFADWRNSGSKQFVATIAGEVEVEVSDGTRVKLPPSGLAYLEDMTGKGHITRSKDVLNIHMQTPPDFDVRAWARGDA
ncbi:MAG TPA: hypothetical protein VL460_00490 [Caulobacteraceae bacterium]|jgi:hypothetical protein|nr:hypothetical protein [Caulobacteraceae bacterium]